MMLYIFLCNMMLIPLSVSSNTTLHKLEPISNKTLPLKESTKNANNTSKLTLVSEGGSILPDTPVLTLPKENLTSLLTLEEELTKAKEKPVVARKGADNLLEDTIQQNSSQMSHNSSNKKVELIKNSTNAGTLNNHFKIDKSISKAMANSRPNKTESPKKPLVLSYEALAKVDAGSENIQSKIPVMESSSNTLVNDQMPSPNNDKISKVYPTKANSHPGMIMPLVITILVVPMFAIVGFMALRRGREAWKNRHYKRMDFLLDGMYND